MYDNPDIGLPSGNEVTVGLIIAIFIIPIGYLILRNSKENSSVGCLGTLFIGVGIIALLPMIAWFCSIMQLVVSIGLLIFIAVIIIILIYKIFNKK